MNSGSSLDWPAIRSRAAQFPDEAFEFVREGVRHTVQLMHGPGKSAGRRIHRTPLTQSTLTDPAACEQSDESRHISGQQLCLGLRDFAVHRYGLLAGVVLDRWGVKRTDDFGTIVYALIDRKELRASTRDSIEDFKGVYDFAETFGALTLG
ncbi:MAG TPA: Minf_1886 family protein [Phycisphaerales bacterium]|nr:Minf_1886 family protein [Phycisphaerales bacterium]